MSNDYRGSFLEGPFSEEDKFYYVVHYQEYNFPGPLAISGELAFKKVKEMIDEVVNSTVDNENYDYALNPTAKQCSYCKVGNKASRTDCWNCGHEFAFQKPYFGKSLLGSRSPWKKRNP